MMYIVKQYVPHINDVNLRYFKKVNQGKKKLLPRKGLNNVKWSRYPEFSVRNLMKQLEGNPNLSKYFPDKEDLLKPLNRRWGYTVLATLKPEFCNKLLQTANDKRNSKVDPETEDLGICLEELELLSKFAWKSKVGKSH